MKVEILISGFGGQGIMSLGKFLAKAALSEGKEVTYFPSYGAEMRGGTAHCCVKISDSPIASPFEEHPDVALIFNQPSLDKFKKKIKKDSILILNSDLMSEQVSINNSRGACLSLSKIAIDCGNIKVANVVALGALIALDPSIFKKETLVKGLKLTFKNQNTLKQNLLALDKGQALLSSKTYL
ncbi:MAG: 2-oxoacid:acceptor oxidoreductase family protein [Candidatus Omnitrophica bacterium]|nr:2-oxoacid:acceptor oxidoreductase family protein [Candidatus Omnitrophota bacterium]